MIGSAEPGFSLKNSLDNELFFFRCVMLAQKRMLHFLKQVKWSEERYHEYQNRYYFETKISSKNLM